MGFEFKESGGENPKNFFTDGNTSDSGETYRVVISTLILEPSQGLKGKSVDVLH